MSYKVLSIFPFERQLKRLAKKYPSLKKEYADLLDTLENNAAQGTPIGNNCYKIRLAIQSKGKGKSGGARVITSFVATNETIYLIAIYDKSEKENLTDRNLKNCYNIFLNVGNTFKVWRLYKIIFKSDINCSNLVSSFFFFKRSSKIPKFSKKDFLKKSQRPISDLLKKFSSVTIIRIPIDFSFHR